MAEKTAFTAFSVALTVSPVSKATAFTSSDVFITIPLVDNAQRFLGSRGTAGKRAHGAPPFNLPFLPLGCLAAGTLHFDEDSPAIEATVYVQLHHPERRAVEFLDPAPRHGIQLLDDGRNDA